MITKLVEEEDISLFPFKVTVDYDFWSATEILRSILPEDTHEELPHSFNQAGHIGSLPYLDLIMLHANFNQHI